MAAPSSLPPIEYIEKRALGNNLHPALRAELLTLLEAHCSWLFNQEVRIITVSQPSRQGLFAPVDGGQHFTAIVVPDPAEGTRTVA